MNIPELTSASSIRSGQGEIREQTGWEAKEEEGAGWWCVEAERMRQEEEEQQEPGIHSAFAMFSELKGLGVHSTCKSTRKEIWMKHFIIC